MPRRPRTDAPGAVHHVFTRRIERRDLFLDDWDRRAFLERLARVLPEEGCRCYAWALVGNHVHLLLETGPAPLARVMQRLGTAYARDFNDRYGREGYLFQGRYGARLVVEEAYFLVLLRYIHRNPIEAGLVGDVRGLEMYPWCGHAPLMGALPVPRFQAVGPVLDRFAPTAVEAREHLRSFMDKSRPSAPVAHGRCRLASLIATICREHGVSEQAVRSGRRTRPEAAAREAIARCAVQDLGLPAAAVARELGVSRQALWRRLAASRSEN